MTQFVLKDNLIIASFLTLNVEIDVSEKWRAEQVLEFFHDVKKDKFAGVTLKNGNFISGNSTSFNAMLYDNKPGGRLATVDMPVDIIHLKKIFNDLRCHIDTLN